MVATTGIYYQELPVTAELTCVNDPSISRGCNLRPVPGLNNNALRLAAVRCCFSERHRNPALRRQREFALGQMERNRWFHSAWWAGKRPLGGEDDRNFRFVLFLLRFFLR